MGPLSQEYGVHKHSSKSYHQNIMPDPILNAIGLYDALLINDFRILHSIPVAHCNSNSSSSEALCFNDSKMTCMDAIEAEPLNIDYRDRVYLGQFRTIGKCILCDDRYQDLVVCCHICTYKYVKELQNVLSTPTCTPDDVNEAFAANIRSD